MKNTDKFLIAIVIGAVILIAVAFAVAFTGTKPAYQSDDTPEGVAYNYLFALRQGDHERAYNYLSPTLYGYPASVEKFSRDVQDDSWRFRLDNESVTLEVASSKVTGNFATVAIKETIFHQGDLFGSGESTNTFDMVLRRDAQGKWKIKCSDSYWAWRWDRSGTCY